MARIEIDHVTFTGDCATGLKGGHIETNGTDGLLVNNKLINNCYDATSLGFGLADDFVHGTIPSGAAGNCVGMETTGDPQFVDAAAGDYHPQNQEALGYGAYAP